MPRKNLIRTDFFPYHLTNRTLGKIRYPIPMSEIWEIYCDVLRVAAWAFNARIHAFVLMSNHYHLLLSTPDLNVCDIARYMQSEVSRLIFAETKTWAHCFDTRYRWSVIEEKVHFMNVYRYIFQNPIRAGISESISEYRYSSFHGVAGYSKLEIPIEPHPYYVDVNFTDCAIEEEWLNQVLRKKDLETIRFGLRRYLFSPPRQLRRGKRRM